jgi:hypothetical protein
MKNEKLKQLFYIILSHKGEEEIEMANECIILLSSLASSKSLSHSFNLSALWAKMTFYSEIYESLLHFLSLSGFVLLSSCKYLLQLSFFSFVTLEIVL